jgi:hypothetical protein
MVTFTATVTDSDGLGDIVSGTLAIVSPTAAVRSFDQGSGGTYIVDVTWAQIAAAHEIEFDSDQQRVFRAEFTDSAGRKGSKDIALTLTCDGNSACGSRCVDRMGDADNCGTCGHTCRVEGTSGGCQAGECRPAFTDCMGLTAFATCDAACAAQGDTCGSCNGVASLYYRSMANCLNHITLGSGEACGEPIDTDTGAAVRCCCAP